MMIAKIALIISIFSFLLTALKYFLDWKQHRLNLEVSVEQFCVVAHQHNFEINIVNKTSTPVSVIRASLILKNKSELHVFNRSVTMGSDVKNNDKRFYFSTPLPIKLDSYDAKKVFFVINQTIPIEEIDYFKIYTNKGICISKKTRYKEIEVTPIDLLKSVKIDE